MKSASVVGEIVSHESPHLAPKIRRTPTDGRAWISKLVVGYGVIIFLKAENRPILHKSSIEINIKLSITSTTIFYS